MQTLTAHGKVTHGKKGRGQTKETDAVSGRENGNFIFKQRHPLY